jgi:hypothetical protein
MCLLWRYNCGSARGWNHAGSFFRYQFFQDQEGIDIFGGGRESQADSKFLEDNVSLNPSDALGVN